MKTNWTQNVVRRDMSYVNDSELEDLIDNGTKKRTFERLVKKFNKFFDYVTQKEYMKQSVNISMLHTRWIFRNRKKGDTRSISHFVHALDSAESELMFTTDFMDNIITNFWSVYQPAIFIACFLPFMLYFIATIYHFSYDFNHERIDNTEAFGSNFL